MEQVGTRQGQEKAASLAGVAKKNNEYVRVRIPASLSSRVGRRLPKTEFRSVDEYAAYVLEQVISELEKKEQQEGTRSEEDTGAGLSQEDEEEVERRLKDLGYI